MNLQFLDQTVALQDWHIGRNTRGMVTLIRRYGFEFSSTGEERYQGWVELVGTRLRHIEVQAHRWEP